MNSLLWTVYPQLWGLIWNAKLVGLLQYKFKWAIKLWPIFMFTWTTFLASHIQQKWKDLLLPSAMLDTTNTKGLMVPKLEISKHSWKRPTGKDILRIGSGQKWSIKQVRKDSLERGISSGKAIFSTKHLIQIFTGFWSTVQGTWWQFNQQWPAYMMVVP